MEIVYKCIVIVTGIVLLILNLRNIAKKKMDIGGAIVQIISE